MVTGGTVDGGAGPGAAVVVVATGAPVVVVGAPVVVVVGGAVVVVVATVPGGIGAGSGCGAAIFARRERYRKVGS